MTWRAKTLTISAFRFGYLYRRRATVPVAAPVGTN